MDIDDLLGKSRDHEDVQVAVDSRLRTACLVGVALAAATIVVLLLLMARADLDSGRGFPWGAVLWVGTFGQNPMLGVALAGALLGAAAVLATVTAGFSMANRREHLGLAVVAGGGGACSLPLAVAAFLSAVIVVVIIVFVVALIGLALGLLFGALD